MHDQTSILSGPRGCQTRKVREVARRKEKLGKTVPTVGLTTPSLGPQALLHLWADLLFVRQDCRHRRVTHVMGARRQDKAAVAGRDDPPSGGWSGTPTGT